MGSVHAETFLVPAIGLAVLSLLLRTVSKQARRTATGFVVQYGLPFKILAVVSALMTVVWLHLFRRKAGKQNGGVVSGSALRGDHSAVISHGFFHASGRQKALL
jgi:hypothetical protein